MKLTEVLDHLDIKPSELADKLGVTPGAVSQWKEKIPETRQWQIELMTKGALKAEPPETQAA